MPRCAAFNGATPLHPSCTACGPDPAPTVSADRRHFPPCSSPVTPFHASSHHCPAPPTGSLKEASRAASVALLTENKSGLELRERVRTALPAPARTRERGWRPVKPGRSHRAANLQDGESFADWWHRGAYRENRAFNRALMAPFIFPESIESVNGWKNDAADPPVALLVIITQPDGVEGSREVKTVVRQASTITRALADTGVAANALISGIVLGEDSEEDSAGTAKDTVEE